MTQPIQSKTQSAFLPPPIFFRPHFAHPISSPNRNDPRHKTPTDQNGGPTPSRRSFLRRLLGLSVVLSSERASASAVPTTADSGQSPTVRPQKAAKPRRVTWGYAQENGPAQWGQLSEEWSLCAEGLTQSPIPLSYREATTVTADIPSNLVPISRPNLVTHPAKFAVKLKEANASAANKSLIGDPYTPPPPPLVGDAPPVDTYTPPPPAATLSIPEWGTYTLRTFHFHTNSSEHTIDGNAGTMETHFIFEKRSRNPTPAPIPPADAAEAAEAAEAAGAAGAADEEPRVAALAPQNIVLALLGTDAQSSSPWFTDILVHFEDPTTEESRPAGIVMEIDLGEVLPDLDTVDLYTYAGSLTTPPGTEGIRWLVLSSRMDTSAKDVETLMRLQNGANVRPLQPLNGRKVFRFAALDKKNM